MRIHALFNDACLYICLQVTESLLHVHMVASGCGDIATADFISQRMLREQVYWNSFIPFLTRGRGYSLDLGARRVAVQHQHSCNGAPFE